MKKEDLKYGNVVEFRSGDRCLYCTFKKGIDFIHLNGDCYTMLKYYDENLIRNEGCHSADIVKIYEDYNLKKVLWERKEKPKPTEDEKAILRSLPKKYKYIARDSKNKNEGLCIYIDKPEKESSYWYSEDFLELEVFKHLFKFVKWEDEEPYLISDLLEEDK